MMPWRLAYCPVTIDARLGEPIEVVWNARSKSAPSCAIRSMCGVFMYGCPPAPNSSKRRSSIKITSRLGLRATLVSLVEIQEKREAGDDGEHAGDRDQVL